MISGKKIGKVWPFAVSVMLIGIYIITNQYFISSFEIITSLSSDAMMLSTTLLGFYLTILTLLNSVNTDAMKIIRSVNEEGRIFFYLRWAIIYNALVIVATLLIKMLNQIEHPATWLYIYNITYIWLTIVAILNSLRFAYTCIVIFTYKNHRIEHEEQ